MDNRGTNCQTEDLILFRRIFEECLRGLPDDKRVAVHQARLAKQLLDCAAASECNPAEFRVVAAADTEKTALDSTRGP